MVRDFNSVIIARASGPVAPAIMSGMDTRARSINGSPMRMTLLVVTVAMIGLGLTFWGVASMWSQMGVNMTLHGWIAYGLGIVVSIALAGGLFFLTFKSARDGYDDIDRPEDLNE
jgi:hypothetical protein